MSLPYFPMYPTDYEAKTSHLTIAEDGAYFRLLRLCWMTPSCTIPNDEAWIMRRARAHSEEEKQAVRSVIEEFFVAEKGRLGNARLTQEWLAANDAHEKRRNAGAKGGKAKSLKTNKTASSNAKAMPKQPEPEPEPYKEDTNVSSSVVRISRFQEFWDSFPHRNGAKKGRSACEKKYRSAVRSGVSEQTLCESAKAYSHDVDVARGYGKGPEPWLNQRCWEDEIAKPQFKAINGGSHGQPTSKSRKRMDAFVGGAAGTF